MASSERASAVEPVQRLFELSVDMLGTASAAGYFTRLNPAWTQTLGWSLGELMAEPFLSFVHPDDVAMTLEVATRIPEPGTAPTVAFENRYRTRDGDYRLIDWTGVTEHGVLYFVAKDVTDRRATEIEHAQAASLARAITDSVTDGLLVSDHDDAIVYVNPSGLAMLGYEADELIGHDCHETVQDGDAFRRKDGSVLPVVSSSSPVPLASGAGSVVTFRDITAQQAAEAVVRRSDELHRILTANLPDTTVFLLDHDLRILVADGEAIRRLPWFDEALFRGRLVSELDGMVPDEVLELSLTTYRAALEGERGGFDFLSEGLTFSVQAVPVRGEDEGVESVLVVARDVTERTRAEQQIARHARQQKAVAELGRFALGTHDLASLMAEAVTTATSTLDVDGGGILELSEDGEQLTIVAGTGLPDGFVGKRQIPVGESANAGFTLLTGEPTIVDDLAAETRFEPAPFLLQLGVVSIVSVPIQGHDRPFGVLDVRARVPRDFSEDEVDFLSAIARLITVAVDRHHDEQVTRHRALHDPLTDLPNRTLALDRLSQAVRRRRRDGSEVAVLVLDIDRFKLINDASGHAAGDEVLLAVAARLTDTLRDVDTVARLSGDEFTVICPDVGGIRGATELAQRLATVVTAPLDPRQRRALVHAQHRHRAGEHPGRHARVATGRRRRRDVPSQGTRPWALRAVRRADAHRGRGPRPPRVRTAPRARARRVPGLVSAGDRPRYRRPGLHRGTRPLDASRARDGLAAGVHPRRRGGRADRRAGAAGARAGMPPDGSLATRHRP